MFVSPENTFRKSFYTLVCVWQLRKIRSMENQICFDQKITTVKRKIVYALILPSKRFRKTHLKREKVRESSRTHPKTERELEGKVKKTTDLVAISDPPTDRVAIASFKLTHRSHRRCLFQTHPPILSPSDPCHRSCLCHL